MSRPATPNIGGMFSNRVKTRGRSFRAHRDRQARETIDRFADRLGEHGDVAKAAAQIGKSASYGRVLLQRIKKQLGWQAQ